MYRWFGCLLVLGCLDVPCTAGESCAAECPAGQCGGPSSVPESVPLEAQCRRPGPGDLVLNEVLADPGGSDPNQDGQSESLQDEFVEALNLATYPVSTGEVELVVDGKGRHTFDGRCVAPGEAIVVFGGGAAVPAWSGAVGVIGGRLSLANDGGRVTLVLGEVVLDEVELGRAEPGRSFSRSPDGRGAFALSPLIGGGSSAGRCLALQSFPGCLQAKEDSAFVQPPCEVAEYGEVVLNELLADPADADANGDGTSNSRQDEYVELMVVSREPKRLDRVELRVGEQLRSTLTTDCLDPGATTVIFSGGAPALSPWATGPVYLADRPLGLANVGATVELWRQGERIDRMTYGQAIRGVALTRFPDGTGDFARHDTLGFGLTMTPGECTNGGPSALECALR